MKRRKNKFPISVIYAVFSLLVVCLAIPVSSGELISGGGFESGSFSSGWVHNAGNLFGNTNPSWADHVVVADLPYSGNYSALLGFKYTAQRRNRFGFMYQDIAVPANISRAVLNFKFRQQGYDGLNYDPFTAEVKNLSGSTLETIISYSFSEWNNQFKDSGWIDDDGAGPAGVDMTSYAGQDIRIYFQQINSWDNQYETWTFIDDVSFVYKKFVDLTVDFNGEDVFGDPGSGDGGYSLLSGKGGETLVYNLDVENEGLDSDSYAITVSPPSSWTVLVNYQGTDYSPPWTTPALAPGEDLSAEVRIDIPEGQAAGKYLTVLDAVSTSAGNRFDSVTLGTYVVPSFYLADLAIDDNGFGIIDPSGGGGISYKESPADTTISYDLELLNGGIEADSFRIRFSPADYLSCVIEENSITHSGQFTTGPVNPSETKEFTLKVTIPNGIRGGDYKSFVFAQSLSDTLKKDGVSAVTRVIAPAVDVIIGGSGDDIVDASGSGLGGSSTIAGTRGNTVSFPVTLQNEGGVADSFSVDWNSPGNDWSAVIKDGTSDHNFPWTTPVFEPFSGKNYYLAVTIPAGAGYDTYNSLLDFVSINESNISESVTASISVTSVNENDLLIDGNGNDTFGPLGTGLGGSSQKTAQPGDTLTFQIEAQNESGENLFDLAWTTPAGWEVVIGDSSSTLSGVPSGIYTLEVRIPASCTGGTFDIIIDGMKTNKKYLVDSVRGRVIVSSPHIVDALIDGNGNEIFGAPGTGAGGHSIQSTIGGQRVNFTLELQNQGGEAESYTASWNTFSGWSASVEGASSGYTTPDIPPGGADLYTFEVIIPASAEEGDYNYIIDFESTVDSTNAESVTAGVHINQPPRVDLVIEASGNYLYGIEGSGDGGSALCYGGAGSLVTASLEVVNRGGFPDSFVITWSPPAGWPSGSVVLSDGTDDYSSPFVTRVLDSGNSVIYTVKAAVPVNADLRNRLIINAEGLSLDLEDSILLEIGTGCVFTGRVYEDSNHDGICGIDEKGFEGVEVVLSDPAGEIKTLTRAGGNFLFEEASDISRNIIEKTPAGMMSVTPDTVSMAAAGAGDTVWVFFGDVRLSSIMPVSSKNAPAGGIVDIAHTITAGTAGQASLDAGVPVSWTAVFYRDQNQDGVLDSGDTRLTSSDLSLDPAVPGSDIVPVITRIFVPSSAPAGNSFEIEFILRQTLSGTAFVSESSVTSSVVILASATGMMNLVKEVDLARARPGEIVTYAITLSNPGVEGVKDIEIVDPVSESVDFVTDAYGAERDIAWTSGGATAYFTADTMDADEGMYDLSDRKLRVILSRQNPFTLESGQEGIIEYKVRIK
ncbi:MAG: hypothetical protein U5O15_07730 [Candidatus Krumholzibacteriota bacterium]|nr:hypothetical protein [Candidatus Krumholzibacteriota bacterium]